mgnify:CR=1 FL=1
MIKEKKYYSAEDLMKLDREKEFIPLTFDGMFKGLFKKDLNLLKDFILSQLSTDIDSDMCNIQLLDSELVKDKYNEYQKTVDICVEMNNILVNVEINREYFKNVEKRNFIFADKLHTMMLQRGDDIESLENKIFVQINLNAVDKYDDNNNKLTFGTDKVVLYGLDSGMVYNSNKFVLVKYLEYYRDVYYNKDEKLDDACLWLVLFTSKSYLEMYNILGKLFDNDRREQFIRNVINMNNDKAIFEDWEMEKLNELVKYTSEKNLKEKAMKEGHDKGLKQGLEQGIAEGERKLKETIEEHVINMIKENIDIEVISKVTNKTKGEILEIKKKI